MNDNAVKHEKRKTTNDEFLNSFILFIIMICHDESNAQEMSTKYGSFFFWDDISNEMLFFSKNEFAISILLLDSLKQS